MSEIKVKAVSKVKTVSKVKDIITPHEEEKKQTNVLKEDTKEVVNIEPLKTEAPKTITSIERIKNQIDLKDSSSIMVYGINAQKEIESISNKMLEGVTNKDLGSTGELLTDMVSSIKGFDVDALNPNIKKGFLQSLFGGASSIEKFLLQYDDVKDQIDKITIGLEQHKTTLMKDIVALEHLYNANLDYFQKLELYIQAGDEKLTEIEDHILPKLEDKAKETSEMLPLQKIKDMRGLKDELERRIYDLKLTRQVSMQSLPSIRLVQENDKALINKIDSTIINTVPLWKNQLAQTITIYRSGEAAKSIKEANDLTNDLLKANAKNLQSANKEVRKQMERGVFDIESIKEANNTLIATLNESLDIAQEGKRARAHAEKELVEIEGELKAALMATQVRARKI